MKKKVLVIDDDADTRSLLAAVLSEFSVDVFEASQDDEGYLRFLEVGPDLVLLDVLLPRQGGLALLRKLRGVRGGRDVPVLVMSAVYRSNDVRAEAVDRLGALEFFKKPFQLDKLRAKLEEILVDKGVEDVQELPSFQPTEVLTRGNLAGTSFPILLKDLGFHRTTGRLNVRQGNTKKIVFLKDGEIVFALSNQIRDTLGRFLFSAGRISEDDYRAGLEAMQRDGLKMGEILIERNVLTAQAVHEAIRTNVLEKVLDLFTWPSGDFLLSAYVDPPAQLPGQPFTVSAVLWEGVRSRFPYDRISAALAPHAELSLVPHRDLFELAGDLALEKADLQFLRLLQRLKGQPLSKALSEVRAERELRFLYFLLLRDYLALAGAGGAAAELLDRPDLERVRRARKQLEALRGRNYFQALEVPLDATDEKVRETYLHKAKEVHPDMLGPQDPPELHRLQGEAFQIVRDAYEALKTEVRRREYLKMIQQGLAEEMTDGAKLLEAETLYLEGKNQLKRQAVDAALTSLRRATELNPNEGEYSLWLGIAVMRSGLPGDETVIAEAEELFRQAMGRLPDSPEPCYRLGRLASGRGDAEKAEGFFRKALARSPNHLESLRELRLLRLRSEKNAGVLGSILGKKGTKT